MTDEQKAALIAATLEGCIQEFANEIHGTVGWLLTFRDGHRDFFYAHWGIQSMAKALVIEAVLEDR